MSPTQVLLEPCCSVENQWLNLFPCFFQLLDTTKSPWFMASLPLISHNYLSGSTVITYNVVLEEPQKVKFDESSM